MSRSPLAYPLTRSIDGDAGGAADLQTDIMRFMAILALCLVAIFALVQSIPLAAEPPPLAEAPQAAEPPPVAAPSPVAVPERVASAAPETPAREAQVPPQRALVLTRPQWTSTFKPREQAQSPQPEPAAVPVTEPPPAAAAPPTSDGFTLRFESDLALTRLVAAGQVGFYAIAARRAQRMAVSDSRISFWDASTPNAFHEMESATVPAPVVEALSRTGVDKHSVDWGVTLPGRLRDELARLMREHRGGSLVITADGRLSLESS